MEMKSKAMIWRRILTNPGIEQKGHRALFPLRQSVYIEDPRYAMGLGALVLTNLRTKRNRRLLADDPSTKAEANIPLVVQGVPLIDSKTKESAKINSDWNRLRPFNRLRLLSGNNRPYTIPGQS
jgi:hypothetical protein